MQWRAAYRGPLAIVDVLVSRCLGIDNEWYAYSTVINRPRVDGADIRPSFRGAARGY